MDTPPTQLAGYRVLRRIGAGGRSEVFLAAGERERVAVKLLPADGVRRAELAALGTVASPALPRLLDAVSVHGGVCLVVEVVDGPLLTDWITRRRSPRPGELVTIAAPILAALHALVSAGFAVTEVPLRSVRLHADGRPAITSLAGASALPDSPVERNAAVRETLAAFRAFFAELLTLAALEADAVCDALGAAAASSTGFAAAETALFSWSAALPLATDAAIGSDAPPGRIELASAPESRRRHRRARRSSAAWVRWAAVADGWNVRAAVRALARRPKRRGPVLLAAGIGVAAVVAVAVIPAGVSETRAAIVTESTASAPAVTAPRSHTADPAPTVPPPAPALSDDPVEAASALLSAWRQCGTAGSGSCDGVVEAGSPLASARSAGLAPAVAPHPALALVQRLGDAAILSVTDPSGTTAPASLLMVRSEAGWLLRDLYASDSAG